MGHPCACPGCEPKAAQTAPRIPGWGVVKGSSDLGKQHLPACRIRGILDRNGGAFAPMENCGETGPPLPQPGLLLSVTPHLNSQRSWSPDSLKRNLSREQPYHPIPKGSNQWFRGTCLQRSPEGRAASESLRALVQNVHSFWNSTVVMVTQHREYTKNQGTVHFKIVSFIVISVIKTAPKMYTARSTRENLIQ